MKPAIKALNAHSSGLLVRSDREVRALSQDVDPCLIHGEGRDNGQPHRKRNPTPTKGLKTGTSGRSVVPSGTSGRAVRCRMVPVAGQ